jgi:K+-sensing histidine kinase KdpD
MAVVTQPSGRTPLARRLLAGLVSVALAAVLVAVTTLLRAALTPTLGVLSPFMLYVGAVLVAGLIRGPLCGALVMLGGGFVGFRLFLSPTGVAPPGAVVALMLFWGVSAPVLVTANELRVQLRSAMGRLSEALSRHDPTRR